MPLFDDTTKIPTGPNSEERNALHDFASYNCLFTLSGLNESDLDSQRRFLTAPLKDVIARSAGIGEGGLTGVGIGDINRDVVDTGDTIVRNVKSQPVPESYQISRDILGRQHDIFFENVNIISTVGPNNERNLANFTKMTFDLHEPYGVTFVEKIRACAYNNGYLDYQAAPFLLTIEWKGFDEMGNTLEQKTKSLVRRVPIFITRVEFDVNEGGAQYNVTAVPYSEMAFDDSYKFPRTQIPTNVTSVESWIQSTTVGLKKQMEDERGGGFRTFDDDYVFDISEIKSLIGAGETVTEENESVLNTATVAEAFSPDDDLLAQDQAQVKAKTTGMHMDKFTSMVKAFEDVIRSTTYFQDVTGNFWKNLTGSSGAASDRELVEILTNPDKLAKLIGENQYVNWFMIKPQIVNLSGKGLDPITKMYPKKIIYKAIPYKVHITKLLTPGMSFGTIDWKKYSRRRYNYIYTGDNVDVQNLRINYKTAYYYRNIRDDDDAVGETGKFKSVFEAVKRKFGKEDQPEPALPLRQYPSVLKQVNFAKRISPKNARANEFFDYLVNPTADMITVELEILGDPAYVAQDIFAPYEDKI